MKDAATIAYEKAKSEEKLCLFKLILYKLCLKEYRNRFDKIALTLLAVMICVIPLGLFLLARLAVNPQGWWHEFALGVAGVLTLGSLQLAFLALLACALAHIWTTILD